MQRKYKKHHKYWVNNTINKKNHLIFGNHGIISKDWSFLSKNQIESSILTMKRVLKRKGDIICRVYPHIPVTKKPLEVRMGKGKGSVDTYKTRVSPNTVLFELNCTSSVLAKNALKSISKKLPFKSTII